MFFRRITTEEVLTKGAVFERQREHNLTEKATVVWVGDDHYGIPHVRFSVIVPGFDDGSDLRILSASAFRERYRPVPDATAH